MQTDGFNKSIWQPQCSELLCLNLKIYQLLLKINFPMENMTLLLEAALMFAIIDVKSEVTHFHALHSLMWMRFQLWLNYNKNIRKK